MKNVLFACLLCMLVCSCNSRQYKVEGNVAGLDDGTIVQLVPMSHDNESPIAEATVNGGKFTFKGEIGDSLPMPICVNLMVKDSYGVETFMLEKGDITIEGKATKGEPDQNGVINYTWDVTVKGSPLTDKFNVYKQRRADLDKLFNDYHEQHAQIIQQVNEARMSKDSAREKQIMETEEYKAFDKAEKDFFAKVEETYKGIVDENKDTYWGPMMAIYLWTYFSANDKPLYESLSPEAQQSWYGKKMIDEIMPAGDTGQKAKQLTVKGDDGKELTLEDLAQGKKLLLIDFWASWCGPCRKEIPNVKKLYDLYKDKGFEVVSISIDKNEAAWRKALQQEQLQWPNFLDTMGAADAYKVRSIPAMFLIDAETLTVIESGEYARGEFLAQKLAELFGNE